MPIDSHDLDAATRIGAWLATYWVHAAVGVGATFLLVRTLLRDASAGVRASAWRAALVAPLVTSVVRCAWLADGFHVEVAWLGRATAVEGTREARSAPVESAGSENAARGDLAALDERTAATGPWSVRELDAWRLEHSAAGADARPDAPARIAPRTETGAAALPANDRAIPSAESATRGTSGAATWLAGLDPRRLALLVAAAAAVLALARWFDGWLRLGRRLGTRCDLPPERAERAAHLATAMGVGAVRITASAQVRVPMAFGFLRPQICLPSNFESGLSAAEWDAALAHELAHVVRGDQRWLPTLRLLTRLFAFQPLNRLAWTQLERESEHAADEVAVATTGAATPLALCLAKVATRAAGDRHILPDATVIGTPTMAARASLVVERTDRLLAVATRGPRRSRPLMRVAAAVPSLVVALLAPRLTPALGEARGDVAAETSAETSAGAPIDAQGIDAQGIDAQGIDAQGIDAHIEHATDVEAIADSTPSARGPATGDERRQVTHVLAAEIEAARTELLAARGAAEPARRAQLDALVERLATLEQRFALVLALIADSDTGSSTAAQGSGARANAPRSTASFPTLVPERDTQR